MTRTISWLVLLAVLVSPALAQPESDQVDWPMWEQPTLEPAPRRYVWQEGTVELWAQALEPGMSRDDRYHAAVAVGQAYELGMPGLDDLVDTLARTVANHVEPRELRLACAASLVKVDDPRHAPAVFAANKQNDADMILLTDAALARWSCEPARAVWRQRMVNEDLPVTVRVSAGECLAGVGDVAARLTMQNLMFDEAQPPALRLAVARAIASLPGESLAESLAPLAHADRLDRQIAVLALAKDTSDPARAILLALTGDADRGVAAAAVTALLEQDPNLLASIAPELIHHPDSRVRLAAARALLSYGTAAAVRQVGPSLADPVASVREQVRQGLEQLARDTTLASVVADQAMRQLRSTSPLGKVQAARLVGQMRYQPAAAALMALLTDDQLDVRLAAVAGLRGVNAPAFHDPLAAFTRDLAAAVVKPEAGSKIAGPLDRQALAQQLSQLHQTFGQWRDPQTLTLLRAHVPKDAPYPPIARAGAIWALGMLYENNAAGAQDMPRTFAGRLADFMGMVPEAHDVRLQSALAIGRIGDVKQRGVLQRFAEEDRGPIQMACHWALTRLADGPIDPPVPFEVRPPTWFWRPAD